MSTSLAENNVLQSIGQISSYRLASKTGVFYRKNQLDVNNSFSYLKIFLRTDSRQGLDLKCLIWESLCECGFFLIMVSFNPETLPPSTTSHQGRGVSGWKLIGNRTLRLQFLTRCLNFHQVMDSIAVSSRIGSLNAGCHKK
ncbi:MAG: hypothetical protein DRG58_07400 [Deltaproteobacteria bacterium]|nr:MAG: hypothetical protein DRG58_07400 [Deltaproteobacteria bacterium]